MRLVYPILVFLIVFSVLNVAEIPTKSRVHTQIVLVGATGDLAKKYLWKGLFELYRTHTKTDELVTVYGAAREDKSQGQLQLQDILASKIKCDSSLKENGKNCDKWRKTFLRTTTYHKLKKDEDYKDFCMGLDSLGADKLGRIFYLSVPPFAYSAISKSIHKHCRPRNANGKAFLRVVLEKPFGADLESAKVLANELEQWFNESEIYRVDHYLGKVGVFQILNFRVKHNDKYGPLWNRDHIRSVEIGLKEKDDCKGRTEFYNQYGVIRDVMQNHMTEVMALVAMEIPNSINNLTSICRRKLQFLNDIEPLHKHSAIVGQYKEYQKHCELERGTSDPIDHATPTFAAVLLHSKNSRWNNVPFIMVSGKQLAERSAYVRILFNNEFNMDSENSQTSCSLKQIIFHIQGGVLEKPALIISKSLPKISKFSNWKLVVSKPDFLYGCPGSSFDIFEAPVTQNAYRVLIDAMYQGKKELFIGTHDLLASWRVWSPMVNNIKSTLPRIYTRNNLKMLDFTTVGKRLEFVNGGNEWSCSSQDKYETEPTVNQYLPTSFHGSALVTGASIDVVKNLAKHMLLMALETVLKNGVFHLALSGGSTPSHLFEQLALFSPEFPWHGTHIWFVDERCVDHSNNQSNYNFIYKNLLKYVPIHSTNIHPMPISLKNGLCSIDDTGAEHYQARIQSQIGGPKLDYVVLGVGTDGHTASIFPNTKFLTEKK